MTTNLGQILNARSSIMGQREYSARRITLLQTENQMESTQNQ